MPNTSPLDFNEFRQLFDDSWDLGYISKDDVLKCTQFPVKEKYHVFGEDRVGGLHHQDVTEGIVLVKDGAAWDYSHYHELAKIVLENNVEGIYPVYTNYKVAAVAAAVGVQARNSLIYSFKFGFDCHIAMIGSHRKIINIPNRERKVNDKMWKKCEGCWDCVKACPANAIKDGWIDGGACENFIFFGDDPEIPNVIDFWHKNVHPEIPTSVVKQVKHVKDMHLVGGIRWDANGFEYDGNRTTKDGKNVYIPHCRECTSQPRCSKWNGKFPYEKN